MAAPAERRPPCRHHPPWRACPPRPRRCGDAPLPLADHLEDIQEPLFYLGAAGGFGDHGLYTTTLIASTNVTAHVVRRLTPAREDEDFGHGDPLYAADAVDQVRAPLARWLLHH
ncbi:hypothetical protein WMF39_41870 [Sorangium sp. So ce1504]|uniref:hypothetical protein n=1 Tax=Sorangium sp. So ce1504 TaxID=3133337 RepID=UPI003F614696